MSFQFFTKNKEIILYSVSMALLLFLLKWLELRFFVMQNTIEIYISLIALFFTGLGIWLALKLRKPKTVVVEKEVYVNASDFSFNESALKETGLSPRELEVLQLMAKGFSNQQIAEKLFVSLNTIKTHSSNVFDKLDVERRTQAIDKAKKLRLIP